MSDPIPNWPGVGETPEPEPEGFREELIEKQKEIDARKAEEAQKRSEAQAAFLRGETDSPEPETSAKKSTSTSTPTTSTTTTKSTKH